MISFMSTFLTKLLELSVGKRNATEPELTTLTPIEPNLNESRITETSCTEPNLTMVTQLNHTSLNQLSQE